MASPFFSKIPLKKTLVLGAMTVLIVLGLLKSAVGVDQFRSVIDQANLKYIFIAFIVTLPFIPLATIRWWFILWASGHKLPLKQVFLIVLASGPFIIVPGRIGDLVRSYPIRNRIPISQSTATIILEKVIDIIILLLYITIGFFVLQSYIYSTIALFLCISIIPGLLFAKWLLQKLGLNWEIFKKIADAFSILKTARNNKMVLAMGIISSAINWFQSMLMIYFLFLAFGASVPILAIMTYLPITLFAGLIPISLAGIGVREGLIIPLFINYATPAQSLAVGLGYSVLGYLFPIVVGAPFLIKFFLKPAPYQGEN